MKRPMFWCATLLLCLALSVGAQPASAEGWDPTDKDQIFFTLQSRIMAIDYEGNRLVVAEREIELFGVRDNGRELATMLRKATGGPIEWRSLQRGDLVFIRGFEQSASPVLAREIYLLPVEGGAKTYPFQQNIPDWSWSPVTAKGAP